jgi:hypothetical protein
MGITLNALTDAVGQTWVDACAGAGWLVSDCSGQIMHHLKQNCTGGPTAIAHRSSDCGMRCTGHTSSAVTLHRVWGIQSGCWAHTLPSWTGRVEEATTGEDDHSQSDIGFADSGLYYSLTDGQGTAELAQATGRCDEHAVSAWASANLPPLCGCRMTVLTFAGGQEAGSATRRSRFPLVPEGRAQSCGALFDTQV